MFCPICQRPANELIATPYLHGTSLDLTLKIPPGWQHSDGARRGCVESLLHTVGELEDLANLERPSAIGFNQHYRYTLTKREHGQWHHRNPDMERWRQRQIVERVGEEALEAGYDSWLVFDVDEGMLAQGTSGR